MNRYALLRRLVSVIVSSSLVACIEDGPIPPPGPSLEASLTWTVSSIPDSEIFEDPHMLALARDADAFAGFYYNDAGDLEIAVTDASRSAEVEARVRNALQRTLRAIA